MASSVDPYTSPDDTSQMTSTSSSHSYQNPNDGSASSVLLSSRTDRDKLERSNQRMTLIFRILVVVCILIVFAYAVTIIFLVISLSRMNSDQSSGSWRSRESAGRQGASSSSDGEQYCVHENEIEEFKSIWDPEDQKSMMDLLKDTAGGFTYDSRTGRFCFTSLQWVPQIMGKIHSRVQESVSYIESQQEKINETVNRYTSTNNSVSKCTTTEKDPAHPAYAVYAHYFIFVNHSKCGEGPVTPRPVRLTHVDSKMSTSERINVDSTSGRFTVIRPGFYFVYSHLLFCDDKTKVHRVIRIRNMKSSTLMESMQGSASYLQGVFRLLKNDQLVLNASVNWLDGQRERVSYFGTYLIRT
ncbi:hypothetical protein ACOMHN_014675 [Nucella lapillus]